MAFDDHFLAGQVLERRKPLGRLALFRLDLFLLLLRLSRLFFLDGVELVPLPRTRIGERIEGRQWDSERVSLIVRLIQEKSLENVRSLPWLALGKKRCRQIQHAIRNGVL